MVICMIPWMEVFLSAFRLNERTLEEVREFTSAMDAGGLKKIRDLGALLSFRNLTGFKSIFTAENSQNVCLWNGVWCIQHTRTGCHTLSPFRIGRYPFPIS
jgi:hypothetical protein